MDAAIPSADQFVGGVEVTATKLHNIVDNATFTNLEYLDFLTGQRPVAKSGTVSAQETTGQTLLQTSGSNFTMLVYDGTDWKPMCNGVWLRNISGLLIAQYSVVIQDTTENNKMTRQPGTNNLGTVIGVCLDDTPSGTFGRVVTNGLTKVLIDSTPTPQVGSTIVTTDAASGKAKATNGATGVGHFGRIIDATNGICYIYGMTRTN